MSVKNTPETFTIWQAAVHICAGNKYGAAGILGNLYAESGCKPNNLQNSFERKLKMSDDEYTAAVDSGKYKDFATDKAGYGIAQWTIANRKRNMLAAAKVNGMSIGSIEFQTYFLCMELYNYSYLLDRLRNAETIYQAASEFLMMYEKPSNITQEKRETRANFAKEYYDLYSDEPIDRYTRVDYVVLKRGSKGEGVKNVQRTLMELGYSLPDPGVDGCYGKGTAAAVKKFQQDVGLTADGIAGALTQNLLIETAIKRHEEELKQPVYTVTISHLTEEEAASLFEAYQNYCITMEEEHE